MKTLTIESWVIKDGQWTHEIFFKGLVPEMEKALGRKARRKVRVAGRSVTPLQSDGQPHEVGSRSRVLPSRHR